VRGSRGQWAQRQHVERGVGLAVAGTVQALAISLA